MEELVGEEEPEAETVEEAAEEEEEMGGVATMRGDAMAEPVGLAGGADWLPFDAADPLAPETEEPELAAAFLSFSLSFSLSLSDPPLSFLEIDLNTFFMIKEEKKGE